MTKHWGSTGLEYWFLFVGLTIGALLVFITPAFQAPDEDSHFKRAYALSEGGLGFRVNEALQPGHFLPRAVVDFEQSHRRMIGDLSERYSFRELYDWSAAKRIDRSDKIFHPYSSARSSFLLYIPQAFGVALARNFGNDSPLAAMHLGRFANLVVFCIAIFWTIRWLPVAKVSVGLLSVMPMTLHLASSMSYDVSVISTCFLMTAFLLRRALVKGLAPLRKRDISGLVVGSVLLAELKTVYFLILALILLVPRESFGRLRRWAIVGTVLAVGPLFGLFRRILEYFWYPDRPHNPYLQGQIDFVLNHPARAVAVIPRSLVQNFGFYYESFVGKLGWLDTNPPSAFILILSIIIALFFILEQPSVPLSVRSRSLLLFVSAGCTALIFAVFYLIWTPLPGHPGVGSSVVDGVQGRYFIPLAILPGVAISGTRLSGVGPNRSTLTVIKAVAVVSGGMSVFTVLLRYY